MTMFSVLEAYCRLLRVYNNIRVMMMIHSASRAHYWMCCTLFAVVLFSLVVSIVFSVMLVFLLLVAMMLAREWFAVVFSCGGDIWRVVLHFAGVQWPVTTKSHFCFYSHNHSIELSCTLKRERHTGFRMTELRDATQNCFSNPIRAHVQSQLRLLPNFDYDSLMFYRKLYHGH